MARPRPIITTTYTAGGQTWKVPGGLPHWPAWTAALAASKETP